MRDSLVFYRSFYEAVKDLPPEQFKACVCAIMDYGLDEIAPSGNGIEKTVYMMAKPQIDANNKRYQNGTKGGRPKTETKPNDNQTKPNGHFQKPNENVNVNENVNENDIKNTISPATKIAPDSPTVISIPLIDGTTHNVTQADVERYSELYQGISPIVELRKIVAWCEANPKNRKTAKGVKRFVNAWLSRAQDKAPTQKPKKGVEQYNQFMKNDYDFDALEKELLKSKNE